MEKDYKRVSNCRVCLSNELADFLELGHIPPANGFLESKNEEEHRFPLTVSVCQNCHHVQLRNTVDRELLFSEYHYFSSRSEPIQQHFAEYARSVRQQYLNEDDFVVEIGSNDGVLLQNFDSYERLGVEPAANVAKKAKERGIPTKVEFFSEDVAHEIRDIRGKAKVIMANNVVGHIDDLQSLMRGVDTLLTDDGTFIVEVPYFVELFNDNEFDTIYHEHISYFSMHSFQALANRHDMVIADVERVPVHGGSVRVHIQKSTEPSQSTEFVDDLLGLEQAKGLDDLETYRRFAEEVEAFRGQIQSLLTDIADRGGTIVGYGAPAKGNILLNYCDIGPDVIDFIIDTTPMKQGTYTPGTNIPVHPPEKFDEEAPEYTLLLAWNYRDEILEKEVEYRDGGKFVIPIPHLDVV